MKAVLLVVSLVLMGMPAHGVPGSNEKLVTYQSHQISPLILPDNIRRYVASLGLDEMQGTIADVRYESYLDALDSIVEASIAREATIRKRLDGILKGRYRAAPGEVQKLRVDLEKSKRQNWKMVDEQLDLLLEDIAAISPEIGRNKIDRSKFDLFRRSPGVRNIYIYFIWWKFWKK